MGIAPGGGTIPFCAVGYRPSAIPEVHPTVVSAEAASSMQALIERFMVAQMMLDERS